MKPLGTGVWNEPRVFAVPALQGGWFASPDNRGFNAFAGRYRARFNADPTRLATLSYDAVSLAAALARTQGSQRFSESVLTNPSGFAGADGVFRFKPDGTNDRALAVQEIRNGSVATVSAAPRALRLGTQVARLLRRHSGAAQRNDGAGHVLSRQIRHHRVEHRKAFAGHREALSASGGRESRRLRGRGCGSSSRRAAGQGRVAGRVDALPQAQAHEQELVALGLGREALLLDDAVALALDPFEPGLGMLLGRGRDAARSPVTRRPWAPGPMPAYSP